MGCGGCESWQEAISASLDGEAPTTAPELVEAHLRRCAACRAFAEQAEQLRRRARVRPASDESDLAASVSRAIAVADRASVAGIARLGLVVVAVQIMVLAVPELLGSFADHGSRHLGSFSIAYVIALVVVAVRPARAPTVLPVALVLVAALGVTAVADAARGSVAWLGEVSHAPELLSVLLLWSMTRRHPGDGGGVRQPLRLVDGAAAGGGGAGRDRGSA